MSVALKGRNSRNQVLEQLLPLLWLGAVERAITLLQAIDPAQVKNQTRLDDLIGYFQRQQPYIPCYAVRKRHELVPLRLGRSGCLDRFGSQQ